MNDATPQALTALAAKLGTTAEYLWGVLLKQATITGVIDVFWGTVLFAISVLALWIVYYRVRCDSPTWEYDEGTLITIRAFVTTIAGICIPLGASLITRGAIALTHPEYWALQRALGK